MKLTLLFPLFAAVLVQIQAATIPDADVPADQDRGRSEGIPERINIQQIESIVAIGQKALEIMERTSIGNEEDGMLKRLRNSLGTISELSEKIEESYYMLNAIHADSRFDFCVNITFSIAKAERLVLDFTRLAENIENTFAKFEESARTTCNLPGFIRKTICLLNLTDSYYPEYQAHKRELVAVLEKSETIWAELQSNIHKCFYE